MFKDRAEAGRMLAQKLDKLNGENALVYALPRGGAVLGYEVAKALGAPLDSIATRKIGHPYSPEYAIGVVDQNGTRILNVYESAGVDPEWLEEETKRQIAEAKRRASAYRSGMKPIDPADKTVIIVDDGLATGFSMQLAVRTLKARGPKKIIVAVPVGTTDAIQLAKNEGADEVIVLEPPEQFLGSVGAHYAEFEQVEDAEVINLMQKANEAQR